MASTTIPGGDSENASNLQTAPGSNERSVESLRVVKTSMQQERDRALADYMYSVLYVRGRVARNPTSPAFER